MSTSRSISAAINSSRSISWSTSSKRIAGVKLKRSYKLDAPKGVRGRNSDNTPITSLLGWAPSIRLEEGMRHTYEWIRQQMTAPTERPRHLLV